MWVVPLFNFFVLVDLGWLFDRHKESRAGIDLADTTRFGSVDKKLDALFDCRLPFPGVRALQSGAAPFLIDFKSVLINDAYDRAYL